MSVLQRDLFLITLESQFRDIFYASKSGKDNTELRLRAQGFIHAGELLQLCTRQDVQQRMEKIHLEIFGVSISQRKPSEATKRQHAILSGDYDYFDEPAWLRQQKAKS